MSQVRKLLNGDKIEKHQKGHVIIGSKDYDMNDDAVRTAFENYLSLKGKDYGEFLSGVMDLVNSGENYYGDKIGNYANYLGSDKKTIKKLSKKRSELQMMFDALSNNSVQRAKNAIHYINQFTYNKPETPKTINKIESNKIKLDFNTDKGKYYLSKNAGENLSAKNRILKIFEHVKNDDSSEYDASDYNLDAIRSWINNLEGDDKNESANTYLEDLWNRMSTIGYQTNQDDQDFFRNFNIFYELPQISESTTVEKSTASDTSPSKQTTTINQNAAENDELITKPEQEKVTIEIPIENSNKKIVQTLPASDSVSRKVRIHTTPLLTSGVRSYDEKTSEDEGVLMGHFVSDGMGYDIYKRNDGSYFFLSTIGRHLYDLIGKNKITGVDVENLLNGSIPKDFRKNLHNAKDTEFFRKSIPNFLRAIQLSTPIGRLMAGATPFPSADDAKFYVAYKKGGILKAENGNSLKNPGWGLDVPSLYRYVEPLLGLGQYVGVSRYQNKQRNLSKKSVEAARYQLSPTVYNQYRTDSPALQQQRSQLVDQQMQNTTAISSDPTQYYANKLMRDAQLRRALNENTMQQSDYENKMTQQNVAIQNQNLANAVQTANQNRQINASINSALYNPDIQWNAERKQSFENKILEIRNKINKQTDILNNLQINRINDKYIEEYNNNLDTLPGVSNLRKEWNVLGEIGQSGYNDFEDYLLKYDNGKLWKQNNWGIAIDKFKKQRDEAIQNSTAKIMIDPILLQLLGTKHEGNRSILKKGGYLKGNTRYTMEPDERIWVENNKSTHKAIAKLSDNTIKLLLRALK